MHDVPWRPVKPWAFQYNYPEFIIRVSVPSQGYPLAEDIPASHWVVEN